MPARPPERRRHRAAPRRNRLWPGRRFRPAAPTYRQTVPYPLGAAGRAPVVEHAGGSGAAYAAEPALGHHAEGNRQFVVTGFWLLLVASVALWWFDTPAGSITGEAAVFTAVGRITGMVSGFLLLAQVLVVSRVGWLEEWAGADHLMAWHRWLGPLVLVTVLAHTVFVVYGYALAARTSVAAQTWSLLNTSEDMADAFAATGILVAVSFMAVRAVRRRMRYETWYVLHLTTYGSLLLGYGHQFAFGADLQSPVAGGYWNALYALVVVCLVWGRVVEPLSLNLRHQLRVAAVVPEADGMFSVYLRGRKLHKLKARPGQFFRWRFLTGADWWQSHPYSLSSAPNPEWLRLTVNPVGDHTSRLRSLKVGTRVVAAGPFGAFTADRRLRNRVLLIAGGSGIAPVRAVLERMPPSTVLVYRAGSLEEIVFRDELDILATERDCTVHYVVGSRHDPGPARLFSPEGLVELVPDVTLRDVYLCGPPGLIAAALGALAELRVPRGRIHLDPFEF
ncbi:ferric reductase-like transmembrane domain-containing protein [Streptomyces sp. R39]|uniref:Ferric reductase-like transmembrane domain-containing protein n=1 Tax=Streptomyces sp. R39 TaxID=3238631 RepID=A0AB39QZS5_9ACTN